MIFGQVYVISMLVEFDVDEMCPNESTKNWRKGGHGLNCNFLSLSRPFSKFTRKITLGKKLHVSPTIWKF